MKIQIPHFLLLTPLFAIDPPILACLGVEKKRIRYPDTLFYEAWSIADSNR